MAFINFIEDMEHKDIDAAKEALNAPVEIVLHNYDACDMYKTFAVIDRYCRRG